MSGSGRPARGRTPRLAALAAGCTLAFAATCAGQDGHVAAAEPGPVSFRVPDRRLPRERDDTWAIALGDVDGDGDLDALLANRDEPNRLVLNDGAAHFEDASERLPADRDFTADVVLADFDGDGDLDAFFANFRAQNRLCENDGAGSFRDVTERLPRDGTLNQSVAAGDVDGDGDLDLLLGISLGQRDRLYDNDGTGTFELTRRRMPGVGTWTICVELGDLDADGDLDAFLGTQGGLPSRLYVNDGTGVLVDRSRDLPATEAHTQDVAFGDVDGDGDPDVVLANGGPVQLERSRNTLLLNDGAARFTDASERLADVLDFSLELALVDVDGDADLDLLLGGQDATRLERGDGRGGFARSPEPLLADPSPVFALAVGDLDGDGDPDALTGASRAQGALLLNDGSGGFRDETERPPAGEARTWVHGLACGDLDGDGRVDAYVANGEEKLCRGEADRLLLGDGRGGFRDASERLPAHRDVSTAAALGDVDRDGDLDVLVGTTGALGAGAPNRLYLNDGAARFTDAAENLPPGEDATWTVALADLDVDGDLDAWIGNGSEIGEPGRRDRLLANDGRGRFADASERLPDLRGATSAVAFGDLDDDLDLDVLLVDRDGPELVLVNEREAGFRVVPGAWPQSAYLLEDKTTAAALVDVDDDGDLDAVLANRGADRPNRLFRNDGDGRFVDASFLLPPFPADRMWTTSLAVADFDGNGHPDLAFGTASTPELEGGAQVFLVYGDGNFVDAEAELVTGHGDVAAIAAEDLDGDGVPDLVLGHWLRPLRVHLGRREATPQR